MKKLFNFRDWKNFELLVSVVILALFALGPVFGTSPFYLNILVMSLIVAYMAMSWNLLGGICGQLFLGGGVIFFGIGAYSSTILLVDFKTNPWIGIVVGVIIAVIFSLFIARLTLAYDLKRDYLALFSIALSQILAMIAINVPFLGGVYGFNLPQPKNTLASISWTSKLPYLYLMTVMVLGMVVLTYSLKSRRTGRYWAAIREDDDAAETLGVNTVKYKTIAMVYTAATGAIGGSIYAQYTFYIEPHLVFGLPLNFEFLMPVIVGGRGTVLGPLLGAAILKPLSEMMRSLFGGGKAGLHLVIYGALMIIAILFFPGGLTGILQRLHNKWIKRPRNKKKAVSEDDNS